MREYDRALNLFAVEYLCPYGTRDTEANIYLDTLDDIVILLTLLRSISKEAESIILYPGNEDTDFYMTIYDDWIE